MSAQQTMPIAPGAMVEVVLASVCWQVVPMAPGESLRLRVIRVTPVTSQTPPARLWQHQRVRDQLREEVECEDERGVRHTFFTVSGSHVSLVAEQCAA